MFKQLPKIGGPQWACSKLSLCAPGILVVGCLLVQLGRNATAQGTNPAVKAPVAPSMAVPTVSPTPNGSAPRKLALLVGISHYEHGHGEKDWPDLDCDTDLATMKHVLVQKFGFAPKDILILTDAKATRAGIISAFRHQLVDQAHPGDVLVFHFSGHGQPVPDDNGDELDGLDESFVTYDYISQSAQDGAKTNLRDDQLGSLLEEARKKLLGPDGQVKGNITVFLDSCHSGTATRGGKQGRMRTRGRGWNTAIDGPLPKPKVVTRGVRGDAEANKTPSGLFESGGAAARGYVVLSACNSDQLAKEAENEQGVGMGAFTYYVTRALSRAHPGANYRDVFERLSVDIAGAVEDQTPQIEGDMNKSLFANATLPSPQYLVASALTDDTVLLPSGSLQGMTKGSRFSIYKAGTDVTQDANRLAEAEIVSVDSTVSRARLLPAYSGKVKADDLKAARAVETLHNYGSNKLKVLVAGASAPDPQLLQSLAKVPAVTTEGVTAANYDVRITPLADTLVLERKTGSLLAKVPAKGIDALRNALVGEWRWSFLASLHNDNPRSPVKIEMRLVPVNVETDDSGRTIKVRVDRTDVTPTSGNQLKFHDGDNIMLEFRNPSEVDAYVTVLDLSADGSINPVFPNPDAPGAFDNKIPADKQWHRIAGTPGDPFVLRLGAPYGTELFKAITTLEPADFSPLLSAPIVSQRGENNLLKALPPTVNPLGELLLSSVTGKQRGVAFAGVPPANWSTADAIFEVQSK